MTYKFFSRYVRSSKLLTLLIFNVKPYHSRVHSHWDLTTLVLKKALDKFVEDNQQLLEIGTGELAILSIYIAKKKNVDITAVDIIPSSVKNAMGTAMKNGVNINVIESNLFSNVQGIFDIIFWNSVYIPTNWGKKYEITKQETMRTEAIYDHIWDGGETGYEHIIRFLRNVNKLLKPDGKILLGVNTFYIPHAKMKELIDENNLKLVLVVTSKLNPSKVYVIKVSYENEV